MSVCRTEDTGSNPVRCAKKIIERENIMKTYTIEEVAEIVESEGLACAVQEYISPKNIDDEELREAWAKAKEALAELEEILIDYL